ncbi:ABC transporter ATP-binding protein [Allopusillimonas ginsengisoli]|uniref:ABC transporter ATP-binding protein n=1 Tax=Allopusillimonas ginsengisoli TaxID=453575 RepID=UPI001020A56C|nr:ABC transporter ATP-binding protein [Allopusillimonas ginsengisoli]TEA78761.1 ABC transporter ATP-binding protein [Allopusillimonas ginsengisoli]
MTASVFATGPVKGICGRIDIRDTSKLYQRSGSSPVQALLPVDLSIAPGEFISLVGPSGCGKTTLLMMICGLLSATTGNVTVDNHPIYAGDPTVSIAFQKPTLLRWKTVLENVLLPARIMHSLDDDVHRRANELLAVTGLSAFKDRFPHELSGGMQQRASIVRALVTDPNVLLMDEPFAALDEFTRDLLNDELLRLWTQRRKTVVFVTHNISEAVYLSDRVVIMAPRPGRVLDVINIPVSRPRRAEMRDEANFMGLVRSIRTALNESSVSGTAGPMGVFAGEGQAQ